MQRERENNTSDEIKKPTSTKKVGATFSRSSFQTDKVLQTAQDDSPLKFDSAVKKNRQTRGGIFTFKKQFFLDSKLFYS